MLKILFVCFAFALISLSYAGTPTQVKVCTVAVPGMPAPDGSCGKTPGGAAACGPKTPADSTYTKNAAGAIIWAAFSTLTPQSAVMNCTTQAWTTLAALTPADPPAAPVGSLTATCTAPTANADGSALAPNTGLAYTIYGAPQGQPKTALATSLPTCSSVQAVTAGPWCFEAAAVATLPSLLPSAESAHTPEVCASVGVSPTPTPKPPGGLTVTPVTTSTIAYMLVSGQDALTTLIVGTVPLGVSCNPKLEALGLNVVPRAQVTFAATLKPQAVLARCQ